MKYHSQRSKRVRIYSALKMRHDGWHEVDRCFGAWYRVWAVSHDHRQFNKLQKLFLEKLHERTKGAAKKNAWNTWVTKMQKSRSANIEAKRRQVIMKRFVTRFRHREMVSAIHGWQNLSTSGNDILRFAAKIFRHSLVRAFDRWYDNATENNTIAIFVQLEYAG